MDLTTRSPPGPQWTGKCHSLCGERGQTAQSTKTWDLNEIKQRCNLFLQENLTEYHWWIWLIQFCTYTLLHVYVYMYKYISTNQCMNFWSQYDILCGSWRNSLYINLLSSPLGSSNQLDIHDQNPHCHKQKGWCNGVLYVSTIIETSRATFSHSMLPRGIPLRSPAHRDVGPVPWQHPTPPVSVPLQDNLSL